MYPESKVGGRATVITIVEPEVRSLLDVAADSAFTRVHTSSVAEAIQSVRSYHAQALLLSPSIMERHSVPEITELVRRSPGVIPVALLAFACQRSDDILLTLGACGVRRVVDLGRRDGWDRLRCLVDDTGGETGTAILSALLGSLPQDNLEICHFFGDVVRLAPSTPRLRYLARKIGVHPGTLTSRFFRAGLPSPKMYLTMTRLSYAASYLEVPRISIADVANRLSYSSPQSFGRHTRITLGLTAGEYRCGYVLRTALEHFVNRLIMPYADVLRTFAPLSSGPVERLRWPRPTSLRIMCA